MTQAEKHRAGHDGKRACSTVLRTVTLGEQDRRRHGGASDGRRVAQGSFLNQNGNGMWVCISLC